MPLVSAATERVGAFIVSANLSRRNLTKSQRAMALAMIYPNPDKGGRGKKASATEGFSSTRISYARAVLRHSRDLAETVLKGSTSLDEAYAKAKEAQSVADRKAQQSTELRMEAPDLLAKSRGER